MGVQGGVGTGLRWHSARPPILLRLLRLLLLEFLILIPILCVLKPPGVTTHQLQGGEEEEGEEEGGQGRGV